MPHFKALKVIRTSIFCILSHFTILKTEMLIGGALYSLTVSGSVCSKLAVLLLPPLRKYPLEETSFLIIGTTEPSGSVILKLYLVWII